MYLHKQLCCSLSSIFNFTLSYLIMFHSPKKLRIYKYLLLYTSVFENIYSILDVITEPVFHSQMGGFIIFHHSEKLIVSREVDYFIVCLYCGCFGFSLGLFAVQFIYRYGAVDKLFYKKYLSGIKVYSLFIVPFLYYSWWAGNAYFFLPYTEQSDKIMESSVFESYGIRIQNTSYVSMIYHLKHENGVPYLNWNVFNVSFCYFFMLISSMLSVLYFGINCYSKICIALKFSSSVSKITKSLQQQLFQALVIQTLIPTILIYLPAVLLFFFAVLNLKTDLKSPIIGITITIFPAVDPLPNMILIRNYRMAIQSSTVHSYHGAFVVFRVFNDSIFSREVSFHLVCVYCGCFGFSMAIFAVHFIYRYGAVENAFHQKFLSEKKVYMLLVIPMFYGVWWCVICQIFYHFSDATDQYMNASMSSTYDLETLDTSYICVFFHPPDENGVEHANLPIFGAISNQWFMIISSMFSVFFFGIKCYFKIKNSLKTTNAVSNVTKNLQQQLFQALVLQTLIPLILMYVPIAILFTSPMLRINLGFNTSFVGYTIATYPAIDPLPNMIIIKCYRRAIKEWVLIIFRKNPGRVYSSSSGGPETNSRTTGTQTL